MRRSEPAQQKPAAPPAPAATAAPAAPAPVAVRPLPARTPTAPRTLARRAKPAPRAASPRATPPPPTPAADLAAAAAAVGAEIHTGGDFLEISFPPPEGAAPPPPSPLAAGPSIARTPAGPAPTAPQAPQAIYREAAPAARELGGGHTLARAASGSHSSSGGSATDAVVDAVLRAMREENEHLGILDGIDPLY